MRAHTSGSQGLSLLLTHLSPVGIGISATQTEVEMIIVSKCCQQWEWMTILANLRARLCVRNENGQVSLRRGDKIWTSSRSIDQRLFSATNLDIIEQSKEITEYLSNTTNEIIEKQGKNVREYLSNATNIMEKQGTYIQHANNLYVAMITLLFIVTFLLLSITILIAYRMHESKLSQR